MIGSFKINVIYSYHRSKAAFGTFSSVTSVSKMYLIFWDREMHTISWERVVRVFAKLLGSLSFSYNFT